MAFWIPLLIAAAGAAASTLAQQSAAKDQQRVANAALERARGRQRQAVQVIEAEAAKAAPEQRIQQYEDTQKSLAEALRSGASSSSLAPPLFERGRTSAAYDLAREQAGAAAGQRLTADAGRLAAANAWAVGGQQQALARNRNLSLAGLLSTDAGRIAQDGQNAASWITPNPWVMALGQAAQAYGASALAGQGTGGLSADQTARNVAAGLPADYWQQSWGKP